jgi:HdeA/HdeB family
MKSLLAIAVLGTAALSLAGIGASAQEPEPEIDIQTIDCRTMLKMDNDEQEFTLIYFHGFKSGQSGEMMFNGPVLREATNEIMDWCIDNPSETLMKAFQEKR